MLPTVILKHIITSSHSEAYSGGSMKLSYGIFLRHHCFMALLLLFFSLSRPLQGPPYGGCARGCCGARNRHAGPHTVLGDATGRPPPVAPHGWISAWLSAWISAWSAWISAAISA